MDQVIPSLADLLAHFAPCFRHEAFLNFSAFVEAWCVCLGPRRLSELWQFSRHQPTTHHTAIYHLFSRGSWEWDELGKILLALLVVQFAPKGWVWLAVDDTICHKRGKRVALGGIFLDPVLSSKSHKVFCYGVNYVVIALVVQLPWRADRWFALPVFWRAFRKKGSVGHRKKTVLARELAHLCAAVLPDRKFVLVGDNAYVNSEVLRDRPANLEFIGPLSMKAALYRQPERLESVRRGRPRLKGERLPTPKAMMELPEEYGAMPMVFELPSGEKSLRVQVCRGVQWYTGCQSAPVAVVLLRDPSGSWRDEALLCTDVGMDVAAIVLGYCRRWSIEVAFHDAKQYLGMEDARVWCERSVERAHPMGLFVLSLSVLWYGQHGTALPEVNRERPWYQAVGVTFTSMLGKLRLAIWNSRISEGSSHPGGEHHPLENLIHCLSAVR